MKTKYPIYIVSKGRYRTCLTAKYFLNDDLDFKIAVEPQEYDEYAKEYGKDYVQKLPFSNLGLGSYPARNWCWEDSIKKGFKRHWLFDDNIRGFYRFNGGNRFSIHCRTALSIAEEFTDRYENIGISGFNYKYLMDPFTVRKPYRLNHHIYSAMLIYNNVPYRWRLKYNEDVDLNLQYLVNKWCLVQFLAVLADKTSTHAAMKGGNQTELYDNNNPEKFNIKTRLLKEMWPQYVKITKKYGRVHHHVNWKKHFNHRLIRRKDINWDEIKSKKWDLKLKKVGKLKHNMLENIYQNELKKTEAS